MAIFHLNVGHISRSTGRSAVQNAAYITGGALYETRRDLKVNFENRSSDVIWSETIAPHWSTDEFKSIYIWDKIESFEDDYALKRYPNHIETRDKYCDSARTAMTVVVALPRELSHDVSIELIKKFIHEYYVSKNLIVTASLHNDEGNPHAHFLVSRRSIVKGEDGAFTFSWAKNREMCLKSSLISVRQGWANYVNMYLEREGFEERITEKNFVDLGLHITPSKHRGWFSDKLEEKGISSRLVHENEMIYRQNKEKLLEDPSSILTELTATQATFTQTHLLKIIQKRFGDDDKNIAKVFESVLKKAIYMGEGIDGVKRYTSDFYQQKEQEAVNLLKTLINRKNIAQLDKGVIEYHLQNHYGHMTEEQKEATYGLMQEGNFSVLLGRAGTGKTSTTLKAVCELYKAAGFHVVGGSLSKIASDTLGSEANIETRTLHGWISCWDHYQKAEEAFLSFDHVVNEGVLKQFEWYKNLKVFKKFNLTSQTVFIVDEAGMIGTDQWRSLLTYARRYDAKIIVVGDDMQCKAIAAGDFFRTAIDHCSAEKRCYSLHDIKRQKEQWMCEASHHFAELHTKEGLALYANQRDRDRLHHVDGKFIFQDMADAYVSHLSSTHVQESGKNIHHTGLVLAYTNEQTRQLNHAIRLSLKERQIPGFCVEKKDAFSKVHHGVEEHFAIGDKIVFLQNDKRHIGVFDQNGKRLLDRSISNGTTGIIESIHQNGVDLVVALSNHTKARFSMKDYKDFTHGYALTINKAQGQTVDVAYVLASKHMDAKSFYVAMTRHRYDIDVFYSKEDFSDYQSFAFHMGRFGHKDLAMDYTIQSCHQEAWHRVKSYTQCVRDTALLYFELSSEEDPDWGVYWNMKHQQIQLGKKILDDFHSHQTYLHQAGLTNEMLQITTGQKQRPLSLAEEKAKLQIELYGEVSRFTRSLWQEIKKTPYKKSHALYEKYQEVRLERDHLAQEILNEYSLYREFVKQYAKEYGISKGAMEKQVAYRDQRIQKEKYREIQSSFDFNNDKNPKDEYTKSHKDFKETILISPQKKPYQINKRVSQSEVSFEKSTSEIVDELRDQIKDLALHFFGRPQKMNQCQWRYGKKGSVVVHVHGIKKGFYSNFETGVHGNAVHLIADQLGLSSKEAFKWGVKWLGHDQRQRTTTHHNKTVEVDNVTSQDQSWTPIFPCPDETPHLQHHWALVPLMKGRTEVSRFLYKDKDGNPLGYVVRLDDRKGDKITPMLTYCQNNQGEKTWRFQGFGDHRPLYGLDQLHQRKEAPVLIVEGEKTCEAARLLFKDHVVVTWSGGCSSPSKTDWSPLKGRRVTLFPDHDQAGLKAVITIGGFLRDQGDSNIKVVDLPSTLPHKWDLADPIPQGIDIHNLLSRSLSYDDLLFRQDQQKGCVYEKTFHENDLHTVVNTYGLSFFDHDEKIPIALYYAKEAYRTLKMFTSLKHNGNDTEDKEIREQAIISGIFGSWAHQMMKDFHKRKEDRLHDKMILTGILSAKSILKNPKIHDDRSCVLNAYEKVLTMEKTINERLSTPPESIKDAPQEVQRGLLSFAHTFKMTMGQNLESSQMKDIYEGVKAYSFEKDSDPREIHCVMDHLIQKKALGSMSSYHLSHDRIVLTIEHKEEDLKLALHQSHQQDLHLQQQRQLNRGIERSF